MNQSEMKRSLGLCQIELSDNVAFQEPQKRIHEAHDVPFFLASKAYTDILTFLLQLNASMFPRKPDFSDAGIDDDISIRGLENLLLDIEKLLDEAPPEPGPRRFGNIAFRTWSSLLAERSQTLLDTHLPEKIVNLSVWKDSNTSPALELQSYLLGSFGSSQRLDYGTGHELSFLAFLGCIWKLKGFPVGEQGVIERKIVLGVIVPYLEIVRKLIKTYNLEPAGSHGVWGLDDHSFVPYIFGSAQLSPIIQDVEHIPTEGSGPNAPDPGGIATNAVVERERRSNMYFGAVGFITDVKKGPFWEHSPMLYDISGVKAGWAKINKGMIKMYIAEVLSKFPVVQHFPFGNMFKWERDPNAPPRSTTPSKENDSKDDVRSSVPSLSTSSAAPWTSSLNASSRAMQPPTQAPWAASQRHGPVSTPRGSPAPHRQPAVRNPLAKSQAPENSKHELPVLTKAPWASRPP